MLTSARHSTKLRARMRALSFMAMIAACGPGVSSRAPPHADDTVGGRDSNPPLALLSPERTAHWLTGRTSTVDGTRDYALYVPAAATATAPAPLVVMLHGCDETPKSFAAGTRMNALADANGFAVLYPAQNPTANAAGCWNWYDPANQARSGEPAIIAAMTRAVVATLAADASRVYVAGMSAGAAMAVTTAVCYPEIFAAVAVHSGLEFAAAQNAFSASWAMLWGGPSPEQRGAVAFACAGAAGLTVPAIVFHGEADTTVSPYNGAQVRAQLEAYNDLADDGMANDSSALVELHMVRGLGHAWSGGDARYPYSSAVGPDASRLIWDFFARHSRPSR